MSRRSPRPRVPCPYCREKFDLSRIKRHVKDTHDPPEARLDYELKPV
jgi:hypothetical protein